MRVILTCLTLCVPAVLALQSTLSVAVNSDGATPIMDKIVFIRLHHDGCSMTAGILHHYCELHRKSCFVDGDLFPFPDSESYTYYKDDLLRSAQTIQSLNLPAVDIFPNHAVLETSAFDVLVPGNFKFSLFRDPLDIVMSSLRKNLDAEEVLHMIDTLQQNMHSNYCGLELVSWQIKAEQVDDLDFVMLTEEYDTSLMMLRRALGWSMFDMMYHRSKDHRHEAVYNATVALQEFLSRPAESLNEATRAYLQLCTGPEETAVYLAAKARFQKQWEQLSYSEQQATMKDTATFQAAQESLQACCDDNAADSYCAGLIEDDGDWTYRYHTQGYWFTSIGADGSTPESKVAQESTCRSMVQVALGSS